METEAVLPLLEYLDDDVDDLEEVLDTFIHKSVAETSQKLPVLDRAKFYIGVVYALESLIFCYLRLRGIDGKQHPVFTELTRLKHYIGKIEEAEKPPERRSMTLDKAAAGRFIKHGLAGNEKFDLERKEQNAKEKARAQLKASVLANKAKKSEQSLKQPSDAGASLDSDNDASDDEEMADGESAPTAEPEVTAGDDKSNNRKQRKKLQKEERQKTKSERRQKKQEARKAKQTK